MSSDIKPLPVDFRDHLGELTGNELKVWMAYYLRTGDYDLTSHPGNQTIEQVLLLVGDKWHYITDTNFGQCLLESQCWGNPQPQWPETASGTIQ